MQIWYWYKLWHPFDHIEAANIAAPDTRYLGLAPGLYTLIHERYRNPPSYPQNKVFETNMWLNVENFQANAIKNRIVTSVDVGTLRVRLKVDYKLLSCVYVCDDECVMRVVTAPQCIPGQKCM